MNEPTVLASPRCRRVRVGCRGVPSGPFAPPISPMRICAGSGPAATYKDRGLFEMGRPRSIQSQSRLPPLCCRVRLRPAARGGPSGRATVVISSVFDPNTLIGETLNDEWTIESRVGATSTGGNFSIGYFAKDDSGRRAFVKVLNFDAAMRSAEPTVVLQKLTEAYNFERDLVDRCGINRLSRVVAAYSHGTEWKPGVPVPISYIVFEPADFDIRKALDLGEELDVAVKLRMSHNAASGLAQLHAIGVAHQDLKPSNLLIFDTSSKREVNSKLGDLGRATDRNVTAWHDVFPIAGDPTYAPPEQSYGEVYSSFGQRRIACDMYQLGNLMAFMFTGTTINARLHMHLHPSYAPSNWGGTYGEALAYVQAAHAASLQDLEAEISHPLAESIASVIAYTTDPDVSRRGHPASIRARQPFAMNRIVTQLDLLARRAERHVNRVDS